MAENPGDQTTRLYIGTGTKGRNLRTSLEAIAKRENKSLSKLLINAAAEKYGIDEESGTFPTGSPHAKSARKGKTTNHTEK